MPRQSDARDRAVATTAELLQRQGYAATGLTEVIDVSGSPKGSFYFHFPEGKEQLAAEAVSRAGEQVLAVFQAVRDQSSDPSDFLRRFAKREAAKLAKSDFELGCPVATVTLEMASRSEVIRRAAAAAFDAWTELLAEVFADDGDPHGTALLVLSTLEGALLLARAWRDPRVVTGAADRLASALAEEGPHSTRQTTTRRPRRRG